MKVAELAHRFLMALTQNTNDDYVEFKLHCKEHRSKKNDLLHNVRGKRGLFNSDFF